LIPVNVDFNITAVVESEGTVIENEFELTVNLSSGYAR